MNRKYHVDEMFQQTMRSNTGCAIVMAGSESDLPHIERIVASLEQYEIPHRVHICSAHKQPARLMEIIEAYNSVEGSIAYVAIAGGTDALSGTLSFHAIGPVISCPPDAPNQSCMTNPPGSSNAYIARPEHVGRFIAQLYAGVNPLFRQALKTSISNKIVTLLLCDQELREKRKW